MAEQKAVVGIADPDEEHRTELKAKLQAAGYQVFAFSDGGKLYNYFTDDGAKLTPSFLAIDVASSVLSGFEACRRISNNRKFTNVPIVMMAKHLSPEDIVESQGAGAIGCIKKPVAPEDIHRELVDRKVRKMEMQSTATDKFKINYE